MCTLYSDILMGQFEFECISQWHLNIELQVKPGTHLTTVRLIMNVIW